jgi:hypothetical protein
MRVVKWLAILGLPAGLLLIGGYWLRQAIHVSLIYCVEARFAALPPDDTPLREWLKTQPGVVPHTVGVTRGGSDGKLLKVVFLQSRNLAGNPPFPDLEAVCVTLGYGGPDAPFRGCADRYGPPTPGER